MLYNYRNYYVRRLYYCNWWENLTLFSIFIPLSSVEVIFESAKVFDSNKPLQVLKVAPKICENNDSERNSNKSAMENYLGCILIILLPINNSE